MPNQINMEKFFEEEIVRAKSHLDGLLKAQAAYFAVNTQKILTNESSDPIEETSKNVITSSYIDRIINDFSVGKEFGVGDIYEKFHIDTGISDGENRNRTRISAVLGRRTQKGMIEKLGRDRFRKVGNYKITNDQDGTDEK